MSEAGKRRLGLRFKGARLVAKLSQTEVAEKCGISYKTYSDIERGVGNPSMDMLIKISNTLDINLF